MEKDDKSKKTKTTVGSYTHITMRNDINQM